MKVLLGMSGGVDSSAAAIMLKKEYETEGVTLNLYIGDEVCKQNTKKNESDAKAVCEKLGIPHKTLDLYEDFKTFVTAPFINDYKAGLTPNPCLNCNKFIKFGKMFDYAKERGFDKIATGHYAQVVQKGDKFYLKKAADLTKDQTYVLYGLTQEVLSRLLLPLGSITKAQARALAQENGLLNAQKNDSQDICFVPSGKYGEFIERFDKKYPEGDFVDKNGAVLGKHKGIINYTVGQRKGLGIALGKPAFVIKKDAKSNTVVLGEEADLYTDTVKIRDINFITDTVKSGSEVCAKLRYSQKETPCVFEETETGAILRFKEPQRAPTAGQAAVLYSGDICLGGGIIE